MNSSSKKNSRAQISSFSSSSIKQNFKINYKEEDDYYYKIDYKNKLEPQYIIDIERSLSFQAQEEETLNQSVQTGRAYSESSNFGKEYSNIDKLMSNLMEKLYPKCNVNGFNISKRIALNYFKKIGGKIDKDEIEKCVNYIYAKQQVITSSNTVKLDFDFFQNLGFIIATCFFMFKEYKINEKKEFKLCLKNTIKEKKNALLDFFNYCTERNHNPDTKRKSQFWQKNHQKYYIPGIFIFLINSFETVETVEINLESCDRIITEDEMNFFTISILNFQNIFFKVNNIKINLNNPIFQYIMYTQYFKEYISKLKKSFNSAKKRYLNSDDLYNIKWDFKTNFLLNEYRNNNKSSSKSFYQRKSSIKEEEENDYLVLSKTLNRVNNLNLTVNHQSFKGNNNHDISNNIKNASKIQSIYTDDEINNQILEKEIENNNNLNPDLSKGNLNINKNINFIKILLLCVYGLNRFKNWCKLDLYLTNSYSNEINTFFKTQNLEQEPIIKLLIKKFHILDLIYPKLNKLSILNCEINSLDSITFLKVIESISINSFLISLNISLFSSDVTYTQQALYKLYESISQKKELNLKGDVENNILDKLLPIFSQNLSTFFNILKIKKLQNFGVNIDIPDVIENHPKYILLLTKFVINLILYFINADIGLEKGTILCPKLKLNNEYYPFLNTILKKINKNNINNKIKELNLTAQLYKIVNIKNIISESLIILRIGNCDITTFKAIIYHLTSYKFSKNSNLKKINLSLIKSIINLNKELFSLLFQIFNIKIKTLLELNIYTNIILRKDKEYFYLLHMFNNNWISKTVFTLNKKSENVINMKECLDKKNSVKYFVPFSIENEKLSQQEKKKMLTIRKNEEIKNDEVFWILKYIFKIRYSCIGSVNRTESLAKYLTNNILSYNHFMKNMDIQHYINDIN